MTDKNRNIHPHPAANLDPADIVREVLEIERGLQAELGCIECRKRLAVTRGEVLTRIACAHCQALTKEVSRD